MWQQVDGNPMLFEETLKRTALNASQGAHLSPEGSGSSNQVSIVFDKQDRDATRPERVSLVGQTSLQTPYQI